MGEVGDRLRQAREAKGLTLEQVEEITKIRRRYLQALEEENYDQLPGEVFIRGFLRNYAQAMGLDPAEILAASGHKGPLAIEPVDEPRRPLLDEPLIEGSGGQRLVAVLIGVMVVVVLGLGSWTFWRYFGPGSALPPRPEADTAETPIVVENQATALPTATPSATPTPTRQASGTPTATGTSTSTGTPEPTAVPPTPAPGTGVILRLEATHTSWVSVTVDGQLAYEATMEPGQVLQWQGVGQISLRTGNAGGLKIWYNGQEEAPLGGEGEVVDHVWSAGPLPPGAAEPPAEPTPGPVGPPPETPGA